MLKHLDTFILFSATIAVIVNVLAIASLHTQDSVSLEDLRKLIVLSLGTNLMAQTIHSIRTRADIAKLQK